MGKRASTARALAFPVETMKTKKPKNPKQSDKNPKCDTSESHKANLRPGSIEWREAEERKLLAASKKKLPGLKALLAFASDHWHYEDPVYRFYHHSFKVCRAQTTTLKIVEALRALAPHLELNPDFAEIIAAGTKARSVSSGETGGPDRSRAMVEALFHARHVLEMLCKYAEELSAPPPALPSGWATVLYLYNIR